MPSQKSLLRTVSIGVSGRRHHCRQSKAHTLDKGTRMLIVKEGREERHYCCSCGVKFVATAQNRLTTLKQQMLADDLL